MAVLPQLRAQQIDQARANPHQLLANPQHTTDLPLRRGHPMRAPIDPDATGFGQRGHIAAISRNINAV